MRRFVSSDKTDSGGARDPCSLSIPAWRAQEPDVYDVNALAQVITSRLFSAGLDLYSALTLVRDGPARARLDHAVTELDIAIKDLRHLMLAFWEQAGEPAGQGQAGQEPIVSPVVDMAARRGRPVAGEREPARTPGI